MKITEDQSNTIIQELKSKSDKHWTGIDYELQDDAEFLFIRVHLDEQTPAREVPAPGKHIATRICSEAIPERKDGPAYSWMVAFIYRGDVIDSTMGGGSNGVI